MPVEERNPGAKDMFLCSALQLTSLSLVHPLTLSALRVIGKLSVDEALPEDVSFTHQGNLVWVNPALIAEQRKSVKAKKKPVSSQ